ncbi:MAG TPA: cytochrome P450 [Acidimicrobiales bacterium]|nr:cytochrome P450 [Acidimicrobiales bacterium]
MNESGFEAIDYFRSNDFVADPYPYYDHLRERCPVHRESHHGVFMVTGYEEVVAVEADNKVFSACNQVSGPFAEFPVPLEGDDVSPIIEQHRGQLPMGNNILTADQPRHTALRSLAMRHFTPKRLRETEPFMQSIADKLIDKFATRGECELISDFSGPFSLLNICALLGVPEPDHAEFLEQLLGPFRDRGLGSTSAPTPAQPFGFAHARFRSYVEDRRANPRDDILTSVATTPFPDGTMPDVDDVVMLASTLFVAGTGTTTGMLATALRILGENPEIQQLLRDEPEQIPNFVEETLRIDSPVKGAFRLSRVAKTVAGVDLPAGSHVMLVFAGANHDPRRFEKPDEFRIDRPNSREHVSFGRGIHACAGAPLARAEGQVAIRRLLDRLDDIRVSEDKHGRVGERTFEYLPTYQLRHLDRLHLDFTPSNTTLT